LRIPSYSQQILRKDKGMTSINKQQIREAIGNLTEPRLKWSIGSLGLLKSIQLKNNTISVEINLVTDQADQIDGFKQELTKLLAPYSFEQIDILINQAAAPEYGVKGVGKIIFIGSGKGGVGKSSVAANLAITLQLGGAEVGLIDADIYGPTIPIIFGINEERPKILADEMIEPVSGHGIKTISIGNLVKTGTALGWRGQMISGTILQFIRKTNWGFLDYLIIDLPPGTGDIQLTLLNELRPSGVILVSMPQEIVAGDVLRSISQFRKYKVPILGIVQNMTTYCCEKCGHEQKIFTGNSQDLYGIREIGSLPLDREFCQSGNNGQPYMMTHTEGRLAEEFYNLAEIVRSL